MAERLLCDDGLRVTMDGGGERTLLSVRDGAAVRFWTDTVTMERIVDGGSVQLSAYGGYCMIDVEGERARLEFAVTGEGRRSCTFPRADLADAVAWVRSLPTPFPAEPAAKVELL